MRINFALKSCFNKCHRHKPQNDFPATVSFLPVFPFHKPFPRRPHGYFESSRETIVTNKVIIYLLSHQNVITTGLCLQVVWAGNLNKIDDVIMLTATMLLCNNTSACTPFFSKYNSFREPVMARSVSISHQVELREKMGMQAVWLGL